MQAPDFWKTNGGLATFLSPLSFLWRAGACWRTATSTARHPGGKVICVGNFTIGGAGKTPTVLALYDILRDLGIHPHFLSRGYGGTQTGPHRIDPKHDTATDVGDEPLLLSQYGPAWVARNRADGAQAARDAGAGVILLDDGLQNPTLIKDCSLAVIDGAYGIGNGKVIPAGPMREPLKQGIAKVRAVILIGDDQTGFCPKLPTEMPVFKARITPQNGDEFTRKRVVAFAGIGRPAKFYDSLRACGADMIATRDFADHHVFSSSELTQLRHDADSQRAILVTTEKDFMRLPVADRHGISPLRVRLEFQDRAAVLHLMETVITHG
ncbi:tetraacyldisaccharide 4'-kinase [Thalassospira sp.]|uniref:tetraacyldisaccharide 4'-kinase n=1 Tax=Thalassospira sp. TaxID=1912094 RepID=UPI0027344566|nr:tetraacyldisaccharide 4'-kinase [Thalassospira sp.]MDP2699635.1 tetraacyldisaccharide 4'-kinase [Thalassospira sp.]